VAWTDEWRLGGLKERRVTLDGLTVDRPRYWFPPKILRSRYGHCYRWSIRKTFANAVKEFQPDIVFAPWAYPDGWAAANLARERKLPAVVQVHGSDLKLLDDFPSRRKRTIEAVTQADGVVAVSQDLAKDVTVLGAKRVRVIYDGVDASLFQPAADKPAARARANLKSSGKNVLFVGNLVPVKSVHTLIQAMKGIDANLVVIGDGPLRDSLILEALAAGVPSRFRGSLPLEQLPAYYQAADLLVLPSRSEGVPNVLLEASACGLPWIASNVGGIPEIAHLGASRVVPPGEVPALRTAIIEMLENPPPQPDVKPRLRTEAVAELHAFLEETRNAHE
jgi:glycosyltransferase involved in cell wall biosynthesis